MEKNNNAEYEYAAVCIWTLCRFEHLRRCLETLADNTWARYTEVYISVDYAPSEKYKEGHDKIVEYLKGNELGFGNVTVIEQKSNLGAYRNADYIINYGIKRHKKLVCIEDDLVFSKNYLEFVNKALDHYNDNPKVVGVWGARWSDEYSKKIEELGYNTYLIRWKGCQGEWSDVRSFLNDNVNREFLKDIICDKSKTNKLREASKLLYTVCVEGYLQRNTVFYYPESCHVHVIDYLREIWNIVNDNYFVAPTVPKIINAGYDGSGEHGGVSDTENDVKLDSEETFELIPCDEYDPEGFIREIEKKTEYDYGKGAYIKACMLGYTCRLFGDNAAKRLGTVLDTPGNIKRRIKRS